MGLKSILCQKTACQKHPDSRSLAWPFCFEDVRQQTISSPRKRDSHEPVARMKTRAQAARRGLLAGGNWIVDRVKIIDVFPRPEQLANILSETQGTGGAAYNVLIDLARSGAPFPLFAAGLVGEEVWGQQIPGACPTHKNETHNIVTSPQI